MKCYRTPIKAEVTKYELNLSLEDGFELYSEVITHNNVEHENLIKVEHNGQLMCPYITTRRGKTFIAVNDYIIVEEDGSKVVCGADKVHIRYAPIEND